MSTDTVLELRDVKFGYKTPDTLIHIDRFQITRGESVFLRGPSGSGKSTLLGLIGGVLRPQAGQISICGTEITTLSAGKRDKIRAEQHAQNAPQAQANPPQILRGNLSKS